MDNEEEAKIREWMEKALEYHPDRYDEGHDEVNLTKLAEECWMMLEEDSEDERPPEVYFELAYEVGYGKS